MPAVPLGPARFCRHQRKRARSERAVGTPEALRRSRSPGPIKARGHGVTYLAFRSDADKRRLERRERALGLCAVSLVHHEAEGSSRPLKRLGARCAASALGDVPGDLALVFVPVSAEVAGRVSG